MVCGGVMLSVQKSLLSYLDFGGVKYGRTLQHTTLTLGYVSDAGVSELA